MDRSALDQVSYAVARRIAQASLTDELVVPGPAVIGTLLDQIDELAQEREAAQGRAELSSHAVGVLQRQLDAAEARQLEAQRLRSFAEPASYAPLHRHEMVTIELPVQRAASPASVAIELNAPSGWFG